MTIQAGGVFDQAIRVSCLLLPVVSPSITSCLRLPQNGGGIFISSNRTTIKNIALSNVTATTFVRIATVDAGRSPPPLAPVTGGCCLPLG